MHATNSPSSSSRTIAIVMSVVGGIVLLAVAGAAVLGTIFSSGAFGPRHQYALDDDGTRFLTADTRGITSLSVDSSASDFTLRFADASEARLEIEGESNRVWTLEVEDGELSVESRRPFPGFCLGWCDDWNERVTLTLPRELGEGALDAEFDVSAGSLTAEGSFRDLDLSLSAGALFFDGAAQSLSSDVSAGRAEISAADVGEADFDISAGRITAVLTGRAPDRTDIEVSAGNLDLTLPDEVYDLRSEVSAGSLDNSLQTSSNANRSITASVSAGSAVLRPLTS